MLDHVRVDHVTSTIYIQVLPSATKLLLSLTFNDLLAAPLVSSAQEKYYANFSPVVPSLEGPSWLGLLSPCIGHLSSLSKENKMLASALEEKRNSQTL